MKFIYKIALFLLLTPFVTHANDTKKKHEKSRKISKVFKVNSNAKVSLNNKYGNLNITTWDKNRVEIEVTITVKGDDLDDVEDKLESIDVIFEASASFVEAETIFEKTKSSWSWWGSHKNLNYKVNYVVKMPKSNAIDLNNDYGNIYLGDLEGRATINCDYGKISVGNLEASNNDINLDYCSSSSISYMKSGDINVDYSKITIDNARSLRVNSDYSTVKLGEVRDVDFNLDYGSISIQDADDVIGNSDYASMRLGTIRKNLKIDTDYGALRVTNLEKGFENVDIDGQYAGIKIGVAPGAVFDFELDLQYAGFSRSSDNIEMYKSISKSTKKYYEGKYGKGNSNSRLKIKSQYGGVSIKEN